MYLVVKILGISENTPLKTDFWFQTTTDLTIIDNEAVSNPTTTAFKEATTTVKATIETLERVTTKAIATVTGGARISRINLIIGTKVKMSKIKGDQVHIGIVMLPIRATDTVIDGKNCPKPSNSLSSMKKC